MRRRLRIAALLWCALWCALLAVAACAAPPAPARASYTTRSLKEHTTVLFNQSAPSVFLVSIPEKNVNGVIVGWRCTVRLQWAWGTQSDLSVDPLTCADGQAWERR